MTLQIDEETILADPILHTFMDRQCHATRSSSPPDRPGPGVTLNEEFVAAHVVAQSE